MGHVSGHLRRPICLLRQEDMYQVSYMSQMRKGHQGHVRQIGRPIGHLRRPGQDRHKQK